MSSGQKETEAKFSERMSDDVKFANRRRKDKEKENALRMARRNFELKMMNVVKLEILCEKLQSELDDSLSQDFRQYLSEYLSCVEKQLSIQKKWEENQEVMRECFKAHREKGKNSVKA
jgi:hypothetical protein